MFEREAPSASDIAKRTVTHEMAREAYFKLHNAVYNNAPVPLLTIPLHDNDVDVILCDYIEQQRAISRAVEEARKREQDFLRPGNAERTEP